MSIVYKTGDLTKSGADVLFHGCNCFNTMGRGVALDLRTKWPEVYAVDLETTKGDLNKLGGYTIALVGKKPEMIFNLYSQYHYGHDKMYLSYDALRLALVGMREVLNAMDSKNKLVVAGPRIGCSNAGGDWNKVEAIINDVFPMRTIYIYSK
jgi:O-acetyl-ADP-ribose deacetylase (regulator of RNase III)